MLSTLLLQAMEASLKTAVPVMVMLIAFILLQSTEWTKMAAIQPTQS